MEAEIQSLVRIPHASLDTPFVFILEPADNGVYDKTEDQGHGPNTGKHRLKVGLAANQRFLEHENRLWQILGHTHLLPACEQKDSFEIRVWREIDRCSDEKRLHWDQQRLHVTRQEVVVYNGT